MRQNEHSLTWKLASLQDRQSTSLSEVLIIRAMTFDEEKKTQNQSLEPGGTGLQSLESVWQAEGGDKLK